MAQQVLAIAMEKLGTGSTGKDAGLTSDCNATEQTLDGGGARNVAPGKWREPEATAM